MSDNETSKSGSDAGSDEYVVEEIQGKKIVAGKIHYFLKWKGYNENENTWEPKDHLDCPDLIEAYENKQKQLKSKAAEKKKAAPAAKKPTKGPFRKTSAKRRRYESGESDECIDIHSDSDTSKETESKSKKIVKKRATIASSEDENGDADDKSSKSSKDSAPVRPKSVKTKARVVDDDEDEDVTVDEDEGKDDAKNDTRNDAKGDAKSDEESTSKKPTKKRQLVKERPTRAAVEKAQASKHQTDREDSAKPTRTPKTNNNSEDNALDGKPELLDKVMDNGMEPEKIIGATESSGELMFLVKWKNMNKADLISAKIAKIACPQTVISFFEERLSWDDSGKTPRVNCS